jgi:hypothetical protein
MKRFFTKEKSAKLTWAFLLLVGLFAFAPSSSISAQTDSFEDTVPAGPYVSPAEAILRLEAHVETIKPLLDFMSPPTQEYRNLKARIDFHLGIIAFLRAGKTVQESITSALAILRSDQHSTISRVKQQEYKQEAIDLLRP